MPQIDRAGDLAAANANPAHLYDALIQFERLLHEQNLLSKTDESSLDEILTRAVRKIAKQHPALKLASKWDLRHTATA